MNEIEKKALALVNEVRAERSFKPIPEPFRSVSDPFEALCRAIEAHEAFRQEVSDAVEATLDSMLRIHGATTDRLLRKCLGYFIIAKPDPLVEALSEIDHAAMTPNKCADELRAAIEKRGGKIVWGEG